MEQVGKQRGGSEDDLLTSAYHAGGSRRGLVDLASAAERGELAFDSRETQVHKKKPKTAPTTIAAAFAQSPRPGKTCTLEHSQLDR